MKKKLQVLRPDEDSVELWVDGRCVYSRTGHQNSLDAVEETARAVVKALGADVENTINPDRQPYRYFVAYHLVTVHSADPVVQTAFPLYMLGGIEQAGYGSTFYITPDPVEDDEALQRCVDMIAAAHAERRGVKVKALAVITLNLIDGPMD